MIQEDTIKNIEKVSVDYNTEREKLLLPEYGRCVQQMVDHAKSLEDKEERQRCATTIVALMANMTEQHGDPEDFRQKLWNHLAAIANYELDIDYPVTIEKLEDTKANHEPIPYPQKRIAKRHYGAIVEALTKKLTEIEDEDERMALTEQVANQMKRSLGRWNRDAMNNEKVLDDIANYTEGKVSLLPNELKFKSDGEILNDVQQMTPSKKKKKK
ncbi:MAG: DUF4290 domain-containing protein [Bacteroidaceae bacterium]|jgi:hypothetical protein|nr:DUF4290 domain-containing protein [Bacteroidaceae bacterium]MBQ5461201.1 DUF4290 domain-containing protein [Bacteroidaceae bacterium]